MSKPKDGYERKSLDLKKNTLKKIKKAAVEKDTNPKEYLESVIEKHASKLN